MCVVHFCSRLIAAGMLLYACVSCVKSPELDTGDPLTFAVLDVGQGLSQIANRNGRAAVWDMGDSCMFSSWQQGYAGLGAPPIAAIIISHGDMDHKGGLARLPADADFSGIVIVSAYEDTAALREFAAGWSGRISFRIAGKGDTLGILDDTFIECLWPPDSGELGHEFLEKAGENELSLCFKVAFFNTSFLLTGDIDTSAAARLSKAYGYELNTDIIVVPHHGSKGSVDPVFYGYAAPDAAIISCGNNNMYGHPSEDVMRLLAMQMSVIVYDTRISGHVVAISNGEYWAWDNEF